ncbi:large subunit of alpha-aminoadipate reductase [Terramyces sp. JEL0728]|nr:large subunit of alpha-aminoadipate reductase [Terramyces sp. JEL0728]
MPAVTEKTNRWKSRLSSLTELVLPTDYPRPIPARIVESEIILDISEQSSLSILKLSLAVQSLGNTSVTPFSILLSAFTAILHRYTGEEDITVGSSSQSTNPAVLRLNVSSKNSIKELIQKVVQTENEAIEDEIPFGELLKAFNVETDEDPSLRQSLFKVRFFNVTDTTPDTLLSTQTSSSCDMTVFISQAPTLRRLLPIQIRVVYNSVLFSESRIKIMIEQLQQVLNSAANDVNLPIGKISLATDSSSELIPNPLADLNWDSYAGAITDIFAKNAQAHPDRVCVVESVDGGPAKTYSYKELNEASNILAHHFIASGIQREDVVVLYSYRGVDLVIAVMGVLKAGATFSVIGNFGLIIDPAYPYPRQNVYLSVAKPKGLVILKKAGVLGDEVRSYIKENLDIICEVPALEITDNGLKGGLLPGGAADVLQDSYSKASQHPGVVIGPDSVGTLSFTSGSTGIPKGVRGRHFSLTHFYPWMKEEFNMTEEESFTMLSGIAHDPIQRDIFTPLFLGAKICIPTAENIGTPGKLAEWMAEQEITITHLTPAMGQLLSANATHPIPSLRHAFFVGDVLTKRDVLRLQHLAANTHVINMYGTTETQRAVSFLKIPPMSINPGYLTEQKDIMPAGVGMKNVQLLVINDHGLLAGVGEVGELYVRSGGLAEGYLGLPEVTAEKFIDNPFAVAPPKSDRSIPYYFGARDRLYRTGDLGRYLPDGCVECTGRTDDQVKIRGFRIELKEIDTHLSQHPKIRENVTLVRRDKYEEKTLVCYFVPLERIGEDVGLFIKDVRDYLKQKLPSYAIPSVFVPLTRMPLTPNGKIDKNALPFPDTALAAATSKVAEDTLTPLQNSLRDIWSNLLNVESSKISLEDNFFDLGGHSILATRLVFEVRKSLAVEAPLGMVYRSPVLSDMVADVDYLRGGDLNMTQSAAAPNSDESLEKIKRENNETQNAEVIFDYAADLEEVDDPTICKGDLADFDISKLSTPNPTLFITGVTGFLGAFIIASALKRFPQSKMICLVRAKTEGDAFERVKENCKRHLVWNDSLNDKIIGVCGDLAAERFGLAQDRWTQICESVDIIIHNGALGPNVVGTLTALKAATTHHLKSIHFVSSTSVLDTEHYVNKLVTGTSVYENDDMQGSKHGLRSGYGQTKWVAEQLILRSRQRGVPATIIRPGYIVGDSVTGVTNTDDFIWRLIKGCIQLQQAPRMSNVVNMCSVDYVADVVLEVAGNPKSFDLGVFHTWNSHSFKFDDLFASLIHNYKVAPTEYIHWRTSLLELTLSTSDHALFPLLHFVLDDLPTSTKSPTLDDSFTREIIAGSLVRNPNMHDLMSLYFGYLCHVGFLPSLEPHPFKKLEIWKDVQGVVSRSGQ